jgi:hypothetical protein
MGNGLVQTQCVIYIAECAPIAIRGTLLASYAFAYQIGGLTGAIGLQVLQTVSSPRDSEMMLMDSQTTLSTTSVSYFHNGSLQDYSSSRGFSCLRLLVSLPLFYPDAQLTQRVLLPKRK